MNLLRILTIVSVAWVSTGSTSCGLDILLLQTELKVESAVAKNLDVHSIPSQVLENTGEKKETSSSSSALPAYAKQRVGVVATTTVCIFGDILLIAFFILLGQQAVLRSSQDTKSSGMRLHVIDNARFFAIVIIIYGHIGIGLRSQLSQSLLKGDDGFWYEALFAPFWPDFPMCGFAFVSGLLSRGNPNPARLWTLFDSVILVQILYAVVLGPTMLWLVGGMLHCHDADPDHPPMAACTCDFSPSLRSRFEHNVIGGHCAVDWYLQFLVWARLLSFGSAFVAERTSTPKWAWLVFFAIAVALNSDTFPHFFGIGHLHSFLAPFVLGVLFPLSELFVMVPQTLAVRLAGCSFVCAYVLIAGAWPWGTSSLGLFINSLGNEVRSSSTLPLSVQLFGSLLGTFYFLAVIVTICPRGETWCTSAGKDSIYPYLLHIPFLMIGHLSLALPLPAVTSPVLHLIINLLCLGVCALLALALASRPVKCIFAPILKPSCWLDPVKDFLTMRWKFDEES